MSSHLKMLLDCGRVDVAVRAVCSHFTSLTSFEPSVYHCDNIRGLDILTLLLCMLSTNVRRCLMP